MGGNAGFGAHAPAQHDRVEPLASKDFREALDVRRPLRQHEAMTPAGERLQDVRDDLTGAGFIGDELSVHGGDPAGCTGIGVARIREGRGVQLERPTR